MVRRPCRLLLLTIGLATSLGAQAPCGVYNPTNGHTYMLTPAAMTPQAAKAYAQSMGGYLASIRDRVESDFIAKHFGGMRLWIGLSDAVTEGVHRWDSGESVTWTNWYPGEPNNSRATEDWVEIGLNGTTGWNDLPATGSPTTIYGLVEFSTLFPAINGEIVVNPTNGHAYTRVAPGGSVAAARAAAEALGGHLVTINDAAEDAFLSTHFAGRRYWIGLSDRVVEGQYQWDSGDPVTYTNWKTGEPNDPTGTEDAVRWGAEPLNGWVDTYDTASNVAAGIAELPYGYRGYQANSFRHHLSVEGVLTHGLSPAVANVAVGKTARLRVQTSGLPAGTQWDLATSTGTLLAGGSSRFADGQMVNLDVAVNPPTWKSSGTTVGPTMQSWSGSFTLNLAASLTTPRLSFQAVWVDATSAIGMRWSQAAELNVHAYSPLSLSLGDDSVAAVDLTGPEIGGSQFRFFTNFYTQMYVTSNGRVMFEQGTISYSPTVFGAQSEPPSISLWCDLNPAAGGSVTVSRVSTLVTVAWTGVPYHNGAGVVSPSIELNTSASTIVLDGLSSFTPGGGVLFMGVSPGRGARNDGISNFQVGPISASNAPRTMLYDFGWTGVVNAGLSSVLFSPGTPSAVRYELTGF